MLALYYNKHIRLGKGHAHQIAKTSTKHQLAIFTNHNPFFIYYLNERLYQYSYVTIFDQDMLPHAIWGYQPISVRFIGPYLLF